MSGDDLKITGSLNKKTNNAYDMAMKFRQMLQNRKVQESGVNHFATNSVFGSEGGNSFHTAAAREDRL